MLNTFAYIVQNLVFIVWTFVKVHITTNFLTYLHFFHLQHKSCSVIPKKYLTLCSLFFMYKQLRIHFSDYHHSDCHLPLDCQIIVLYGKNIALIPECSMSWSVFKIIHQFLLIHSLFEYGKSFRHGTPRKYYLWNFFNHLCHLALLDNSALNKFYLFSFSLISFCHLHFGWTRKLSVTIHA